VRWFAPVALVGAVGLVACGGDSSDSDVSARTAAPAAGVVGSDVHLENQAAELASQAQSASGSDIHLENQAAELAEQQAHTDGNAATMSSDTQPDETSNDDFVPGTRRMPVR
jgi:hypothetical protein